MHSIFGLNIAELIVATLFVLAISVPAVFYMMTLRRTLRRCSPLSRTMPPDKVWLLLIPIGSTIFHFFVVLNISRSLSKEFKSRNLPDGDSHPGRSLGIAMCLLPVGGVIPGVGVFFVLAGLLCWVFYWIKVARYSRELGTIYESSTGSEPKTPYLLIGVASLLGFLLLPVVGSIVWLTVASKKSEVVSYYESVADASRANDARLVGKRIQVPGEVGRGSIRREGSSIYFVIVSGGQSVGVNYSGRDPLPDYFRDGARVVVHGEIEADGVLRASSVTSKRTEE